MFNRHLRSDKALAVEPSFNQSGPRNNSFQLHASMYQVIEALEQNPDLPDLDQRVEDAVNKDFPTSRRFPTAQDMEDAIYRHPTNPKLKFEQGQWCEYLGMDMKWHLGQVKRVVKVAPKGWKPKVDRKPDWDFCYSFQGDDLVSREKVRAPEEALKREFGLRPWVWQQWAFLKVESMTRFQRFHERDFETLNFGMTASMFFQQWLNDSRNADFRLFFETRDQGERDKLVDHLLTPFVLMDEISKNGNGLWDFEESGNISLYLYPSLLGAGWLSCLSALVIQCTIPALLLYEALVVSPRFDMANYSANSFDKFCTHYSDNDPDSGLFNGGLVVNIIVLLFYVMRNLPQVVLAYYDTMGDASSVNSRVGSLRTLVYLQGDATNGMMVGYRIERFMNSTYIALVNTLMLSVLFLTDIPSEIILNALSIEFVINFDDEIVRLRWLDPFYRFVRAATTEMVLRYYIEVRVLSSASRFCREYDIPRTVFNDAMRDNDAFPSHTAMNCRALSKLDSGNTKFMRAKDVVWTLAGEFAKETGNSVAQNVYLEHPTRFDFFAWLVARWIPTEGIFQRWEQYHTWSRWDRLLFVSPCGEEYVPPQLPSSGLKTRLMHYLNDFDEGPDDPRVRFAVNSLKTLFLVTMAQNLANAVRWRSPLSFFGRLLDGIIEWFSIFYLVLFPFTFPVFFVGLVTCY